MLKTNIANLKNSVNMLTTTPLARNYKNIQSLEYVVDYIKNKFSTYNIFHSEQIWEINNDIYKNVIASFNPKHKSRLIIGAHYDVCNDYPGADDNASGIAGLLELSRIIMSENPNINYGIDFVAFSLEEPPFFGTEFMGSHIHAKSIIDNKIDVIGMVCLEMIGYFSDEPNSQSYPFPEFNLIYPNIGNFISVACIEKYSDFNNNLFSSMENKYIDVQLFQLPDENDLVGLSDHRNYWKYDIPSIMITDMAFLRNSNYHTEYDTIDTLNFEKMAEVVDSIYNGIINLRNNK